jgi:hypothetical protein
MFVVSLNPQHTEIESLEWKYTSGWAFTFKPQSPKAMNNIYALAGLLTYSPFARSSRPLKLDSDQLIEQWLWSLQLRDSYGITPYSLLISYGITLKKT